MVKAVFIDYMGTAVDEHSQEMADDQTLDQQLFAMIHGVPHRKIRQARNPLRHSTF